MNSGFPLTFTSHGLGAEGKDIQLTRALIFSSVLSAVNTSNEMKILELNSRLQKDILSGFYGGKNE